MKPPRDEPYPDTFIGGGFYDPSHPAGLQAPPVDPVYELGPAPAPEPEPSPSPSAEPASVRDAEPRTPVPDRPGGVASLPPPVPPGRRRGVVPAALAVLCVLLLVGHSLVPNAGWNLGSLLDTLLPWTALAVPPLLLAALIRRSPPAVLATLLLVSVWAATFGSQFTGSASGAEPNLTVVTHNVDAANPDPASTARDLLAAHPDVVALEEVTDAAFPSYRRVLDRSLTHSFHTGTVAVWSRLPITGAERVVLDPGWNRSLRVEIQGPNGPFAVYVVHLASVRVGPAGFTAGRRDQAVTELNRRIDQDPLKKVVLMGDLNGSTDDRGLAPLMSRLSSVQKTAGSGFGFSWPSAFPFVRIDQILTRGVIAADAWTLPATSSDHRPIAAGLRV
jgi:vancomycin resistance protein VanJ